jgi:phosphoglycerol transferase MdoB-like AlkP superfamily enzyme
MFILLHQKLNTTNQPFIAFTITSTTHSDFHLPSKKFERYPHDLRNYYGALNAYTYTDNAIERFIESVKYEPWFDNTVFIFTADHGARDALCPIGKTLHPNDKPLPSIEHYRIPLVIYAPKIFKPQEIKTLGSQNDIFPTIIDMLGFKQPFSAMGNSLFDTTVKDRFVYFYAGDLIGYIGKEGYIKYNFKTVVESNATREGTQKLQKDLFAVDTAESGLLKMNKWAK